uniref:Uncharacterized protein n=1 Tax=Oryza brachyantha TaxID=4533 RepID=J3MKG5_ORYBR
MTCTKYHYKLFTCTVNELFGYLILLFMRAWRNDELQLPTFKVNIKAFPFIIYNSV